MVSPYIVFASNDRDAYFHNAIHAAKTTVSKANVGVFASNDNDAYFPNALFAANSAVSKSNVGLKDLDLNAVKSKDCQTMQCALKASNIKIDEKVEGPNDVSLLNNKNIDDILYQWMEHFPKFFAYNFNMRDYAQNSFDSRTGVVNRPDTLQTISLYDLYKGNPVKRFDKTHKAEYRFAACVLNTDVYSGNGEHWMAFFVDMVNLTVEFFNSSGNPPCAEYQAWMQKAVEELKPIGKAKAVVVANFEHQKSETECGLYSLFYIWTRLHELPYTYFSKNKVPDQYMFLFRTCLFHDEKFLNKYTDLIFKDPIFVRKIIKKIETDEEYKKQICEYGKKVDNHVRPMRLFIIQTLKSDPEFTEWTQFNFKWYKKVVAVKWEDNEYKKLSIIFS